MTQIESPYKDVTVEITDIKVDRVAHSAIVGVRFQYGDDTWQRAYKFDLSKKISLAMFKQRLHEEALKDVLIDRNISEILEVQEKPFNLPINI